MVRTYFGLAILYAILCWALLGPFEISLVGPGCFFVLFLASLLLGTFLIILQTGTVESGVGDTGEAVTLLSGRVIPAVRERPKQRLNSRKLRRLANIGKPVFFFLSIFLAVFWVKLSVHGLPKEWWDWGYSLLIYLYAYGEAGKHINDARIDASYGDYLRATRNLGYSSVDVVYASEPTLLSLPYSLFVYWALRGRKLTDEE